MSILGEQIKELREAARQFEGYQNGEISRMMREAAYTIESLRDRLQAATLGNSRAERTCKQEERGWGTEGDHARVWLTCGHDCMVPTVQDLPNYCPNCGAKVVHND